MSKESYQPSPEEIEKAKEMMKDEDKKLSEAKEEGYKIAEADKTNERAERESGSPRARDAGRLLRRAKDRAKG